MFLIVVKLIKVFNVDPFPDDLYYKILTMNPGHLVFLTVKSFNACPSSFMS